MKLSLRVNVYTIHECKQIRLRRTKNNSLPHFILQQLGKRGQLRDLLHN